MTSDDPNHRPTLPLQPPSAAGSPDLTRTFSADPSATLPFNLGPPITCPVANWPTGLTRYQPLHLLGDGGMGEVYLAHDTQLDRQVAIKFARLGRHPTTDTTDRILAEARAAARLHHPGICPVFDADVCDGVPYLTMAFVQGPNLAAELKRLGPCPPKYAAKLLRDVAEAMQYAHEHGVIHRDLKPGNILLTAEHTPVVTDFGLAVRLDREGLAQGVVSGTPHYMAPEQAAGDAAKIGERTDVFALGVILFEMLTGRVPFDGSALEVLEQVKTKPVPPVRKLRKGVPERLARIVAKATARLPADRFDGMTAFADALTNFLQESKTPPKRSLKWVWISVVLAGLVAVSVLVCGLAVFLPAVQKMQQPSPPTTSPPITPSLPRSDQFLLLLRESDEAITAGNTEAALTKLDAAMKLDPTNPVPWERRATLHEKLGQDEEALSDWAKAIRLSEDDPVYTVQRLDLLARLKRYDEVIQESTKALVEFENEADCLVLRGEARLALKNHKAALADFTQAIEMSEGVGALDADEFFEAWPVAYYLRALTKAATGDQKGADTDMAVAKRHLGKMPDRFQKRFRNGPWDKPEKGK